MIAYCDTSFLFSLYVRDGNTPSALRFVSRGKAGFVLTVLGELELRNAIEQRVFRGELTEQEATAAGEELTKDIGAHVYSWQPVPIATYDIAQKISREWTPRLGCRALDILHVASAMAIRSEVVVSFDIRQRELASALGLAVRP